MPEGPHAVVGAQENSPLPPPGLGAEKLMPSRLPGREGSAALNEAGGSWSKGRSRGQSKGQEQATWFWGGKCTWGPGATPCSAGLPLRNRLGGNLEADGGGTASFSVIPQLRGA